MSPELSVVIPTCGRPDTLRDVLAALLRQDYDLSRVEIIVVCDGPDARVVDLVSAMAREAPCALRVLEQERQGAARARNRGIANATGRVIVMLDDDIVAEPRLLAAHGAHHAERDDVVVTGALPIVWDGDEPAHVRVVRDWWQGEQGKLTSPRHRWTFRDFVTGNVSVRRERLLAVGGFDPSFTGYGREDYELGLRLQVAGLRFVHEPRAVGAHRYEKSAIQWLRQFYSMGRADVIFARAHPALVDEVMGLSPFPRWPGIHRVVPLLERLVLSLNQRGGRIWGVTAALTQGAHYWRGVEAEVRDAEELRWLVGAHRRVREAAMARLRGQRGIRVLIGRLWSAIWQRVTGARARA